MQTYKKLKLLCLLPVALLLCACASSKAPIEASQVNTNNYTELANLTKNSVTSSSLNGNRLRMQAVKQAGLTFGAQSGLAFEAKKINQRLLGQAENLRTIFNFDAVILNHNILPPVLTEATDTLNLSNPDTIRSADKAYSIVQNAKFVTAPPTWRNYLIMNYAKPDVPDQTLLPENAKEQSAWRAGLKKGWKSGVRQADTIFNENLARLKRDFQGMILYRKLLAQHIVTPPYVASTNLGVTGDRSHLNINDKVLRISALPGLQTNAKKWKPILDTENQQ